MRMILADNCYNNLVSIGIVMEEIGAVELLGQFLSERLPVIKWDYNYETQTLRFWVEDYLEIPDIPELGELIIHDNPLG